MNKRNLCFAGIVSTLAAALAPAAASASFILDSGTPAGSSTYELLTSDYAAEFAMTTGQTVGSIAFYLTPGDAPPNTLYQVQIFSNNGFLGRNGPGTALLTQIGSFGTSGWNTLSVDWTPSASGNYWVAIEPDGTPALDLPGETSASTGTAPALQFAVKSNGTGYAATTSTAFGVQIAPLVPTPLPPAAWLLLCGLAGLGTFGLRRRAGQIGMA